MIGYCSRLLHRRHRATDGGWGLADLVVTIGLLGLVAAAVAATTIRSYDTLLANTQRNGGTLKIGVAFDSLTNVVQSSTKLTDAGGVLLDPIAMNTGSPTTSTTATSSGVEATFTARVRPGDEISLVHWYVDTNRKLIEEVSAPDTPGGFTYAASVPTRRVIAEGVVLPAYGDRPLFSWFAPTSSTPINDPDPYVPLTRAQVAGVAGVLLSFTLEEPGPAAKRSTMQNFAMFSSAVHNLPNAPQWSSAPTSTRDEPKAGCPTCAGLPPLRAS